MPGIDKKTYEMDMVRGSILKKLLVFSLPLMLSSILQLLFNAADIIVLGRFAGDNALAAVGSTTYIIALLTNLFIGISVGVNVVVARLYGARKEKELRETVHTSIVMSFVIGLIITSVGIGGARVFLVWMDTPNEVLVQAVSYLRIYFLGMTGSMIYNFGSAVLRAVGDTKRPLYYLTFSGVVNVVLNIFMVISLDWNVVGVGIATSISQWIAALMILYCMVRENGSTRLSLPQLRLHSEKAKTILRVGIPSGMQSVAFSITNVIIQSVINSFGTTMVAGNSAAANIDGFIYFAMYAFYQTIISFTSQNIGARRVKRIDKILIRGELCVIAVGLVSGIFATAYGRQLLGIYSTNELVIDAGMERLKIIAPTYALAGVMDVLSGVLRGTGCSVAPTITTLIGVCGLRIVWIFSIFQIPEFHTVEMLYVSYPVTWIITLIGHFITFLIIRKRIQKKALSRQL